MNVKYYVMNRDGFITGYGPDKSSAMQDGALSGTPRAELILQAYDADIYRLSPKEGLVLRHPLAHQEYMKYYVLVDRKTGLLAQDYRDSVKQMQDRGIRL